MKYSAVNRTRSVLDWEATFSLARCIHCVLLCLCRSTVHKKSVWVSIPRQHYGPMTARMQAVALLAVILKPKPFRIRLGVAAERQSLS